MASCSDGGAPYSVKFAANVGGQPFQCGNSYPNIGTTMTTIQPEDFRLYVHGVSLLRANNEAHPLTLAQDRKWQLQDIALLDFEDGTGQCNTNSPETNMVVTGRAPQHGDYVGVQFTIGVEPSMDHLDSATAAAPLNDPALWWSWSGGYRYVRLDVQSSKNPTWNFHLGAEYCTGAAASAITCKFNDESTVTLMGFNPAQSTVAIDLAALYADSDLDHQVDGVTEFVAGCMSDPMNAQCKPLFNKIGLQFESADPGPAQTVFSVQ
jgi:uncharacterized repeat protein (TIGR04052 family)